MPPTVKLESAGTHQFDMGHLRRSGAEELIQLALEKASLFADEEWRVRVNEKQKCSGMTPPLTVTGQKPWCVYMRIKPGDNNTCHNVSLILPTGHKAERIFVQLKGIEKGISRNWRKVESKVVATKEPPVKQHVPQVAEPLFETPVEDILKVSEKVATIAAPTPAKRFDLAKWLKSHQNIRTLLVEIGKLEYAKLNDKREFMNRLTGGANLSINPKQGGAMMRSLMTRGYVEKVGSGLKVVGYKLTDAGKREIGVAVPLPPPPPPKRAVNRTALIREAGTVLTEIHKASERLSEITRDREMLLNKIRQLDEEEAQICKLLDGAEVEDLIARLVEVRKPKVKA